MKISITLVCQVIALVLVAAFALGHPLAFTIKSTPPTVGMSADPWATWFAFIALWLGGPLVDSLVKPKGP